MAPSVSGYVFSGGQSSRFGSNKMFHSVDGKHMGMIVLNNLQSAIQAETLFVGPEIDHPDFVNIPRVVGNREGNGPLGAICDVLERALTDFVVFAPCDTPYFLNDQFQRLVQSSHTCNVVVSADDNNPHLRHWLLSCWNVASTRNHMINAYENGERAIHRAVKGLHVCDEYFTEQQLTNINSLSDTQ